MHDEDKHPRARDGKFTNADANRDDPGQIIMEESNAIGQPISDTRTFRHPHGDVTVTVNRWIEATRDGLPMSASEHTDAQYWAYGEDFDGSETLEDAEYTVVSSITTSDAEGESGYREEGSVSSLEEGWNALSADVDWSEFYDPDDHNKWVERGLKGSINASRFSLGSEPPQVRRWAESVAREATGIREGGWKLERNGRWLTIESHGSVEDSLVAAAAEARRVETTHHSDDWMDDDYQEAVLRAHSLRVWDTEGYDDTIADGQGSTVGGVVF